MSEQRFKVGDRVGKAGAVIGDNHGQFLPFKVRWDHSTDDHEWCGLDELTLLPAAPEPRPDWETLREAADMAHAEGYTGIASTLREIANKRESAARPKPTLREAVAAYVAKHDAGTGSYSQFVAMREALDREPTP